MLNVEEDLRNKLIQMPESGLFDTGTDEIEPIPFVHPTLTSLRKIKLKAESARRKFIQESDLSSSLEYFADAEYNETLKYWAVVFSLSIDDEPAHTINGQKYMEEYVENKLGSKFNNTYDELALTIINEVGLVLKDLSLDEVEEEPELEEASTASAY